MAKLTCTVYTSLHVGAGSLNTEYFMNGVKIQAVEEEKKDLGLIINKDLKVSKQCVKDV